MEDAVAKLKELQRTDPVGKLQWEAYTDKLGNSVRDPSKHEASFVLGFLTSYQSGVRLEVKNPLVDLLKEGQRKSAAWKRCWEQYCHTHGGGVFDPCKHDQNYLVGFLNYLGTSGEQALMTNGGARAGYGMGDGPPLKKINTGFISTGNATKDQLVQAVKMFQRQGEQNKEAWASFCEQSLQGVRDPARHEVAVLQQFLMSHGALPVTTASGCAGGCVGMPSVDPIKDALVSRVKAFQRMGESQREQWGAWADEHLAGKRDPARHEAQVLQHFCALHGV